MENYIITKEPTMEEMKENIVKAGGLFYQYRPCRNDATTIYDVENIKHDVIYAQTPLNMNDPFDSLIGFSSEKIYDNLISMLLDAFELDQNLKIILSVILKHQLLGDMIEFINTLNDLKKYIQAARTAMHMMSIPYDQFVKTAVKKIYGKADKKIKQLFSKELFVLFGSVISTFDEDISEDSLLELFEMKSLVDELILKIESIKNETYIPLIKDFLSQLTVSCFSSSGWDNQLMWAHYANSYSGICVEYDLTQMEDFIGFVYPVQYTSQRPTITLQDLGMSIELIEEKSQVSQKEVDIVPIFNYLLSKNTCWEYEKEWRIIDIGEKNTPRFIDFPFIKSITFGVNIANDTKKMLLDVCKLKQIECYDLLLEKESFELKRELINFDSLEYDEDQEIQKLQVLSDHISAGGEYFDKNAGLISEKISETNFDYKFATEFLETMLDMLMDSYYYKTTFNKIIENTDDDISTIRDDENICEIVEAINVFVSTINGLSITLKDTMHNIRRGFVVPDREYRLLNQYTRDMYSLSNKISEIEWKI